MKLFRRSCLLLMIFLVGCASQQQPIALESSFYESTGKNIGILRTESPVATTVYTGSIGLLDYAVISAVNSGLDAHLATLTFSEYESFIDKLSASIGKAGFNVTVIDKPLTIQEAKDLKYPKEGISKNDFSEYKTKHNLDYLIVIHFRSIGTTRSYYSVAPTSEPLAMNNINGQIIDLNTNQLHWYANTVTTKSIQTPWDESTENYPNLTNAVYQALNDTLRGIVIELKVPQVESTPLETAEK